MIYKFPGRYIVQNGQIVQRPYLAATVAESATTKGQYTITATLTNPPATPPANVTFNVLNQSFSEPLTNGQAQFVFNVHPAVDNQTVTFNVLADGCVSTFVNVGTDQSAIGLQTCIPSGGTIPTVAPVGAGSIEYLGVYWTSTAVNQAFSQADIDTAIGLLKEAVFEILMPQALQQNPNLLDANQKNGVTDIQNNVIPSIPVNLENIAPVPASGATQTFDQHYAHYKMVQQASKQAYQNYVHDQQTLPGLA